MEKQFLKRNLPDLIIVEGFWNVGKSSLINYVEKLNNITIIGEPNHLTEGIQKNIPKWYETKHQNRMKAAAKRIKNGSKVIMERSIISNISYQYAICGKISSYYQAKLNTIKPIIKSSAIVFLYGDKNFILEHSKTLKDFETKSFLADKNFYKRYLDFYIKILPRYFGKVKIIKINNGTDFKQKNKILNLFYSQFPFLEKEKVVCSSIVAFHKNKVLLLYDHEYKHFVLPQGHQEPNEKLSETALREMTEETGFNNIKVIKKIKKYQYHYLAKNKIIYKTIHVFLIEIFGLSKIKKALEGHENYSNKFFSFKEAINKARWHQDKEVIKNALQYIKSPRSK